MEAVGAVAHDGQTAALLRTIFRECRHNDMATWFHRTEDSLHVGLPFHWSREKVKHGPVMPNVVRMPWQFDARDVAN